MYSVKSEGTKQSRFTCFYWYMFTRPEITQRHKPLSFYPAYIQLVFCMSVFGFYNRSNPPKHLVHKKLYGSFSGRAFHSRFRTSKRSPLLAGRNRARASLIFNSCHKFSMRLISGDCKG